MLFVEIAKFEVRVEQQLLKEESDDEYIRITSM